LPEVVQIGTGPKVTRFDRRSLRVKAYATRSRIMTGIWRVVFLR
jgi:hypothetical protein